MCVSSPRSCCQTLVESEVSLLRPWLTCCVLSCCLSWEFKAECWLMSRTGCQMLVETLPCSSLVFPGFLESLILCGEFFLALNKLWDTRFIGLDFAIGEPSLEVLFWLLFAMARCFQFERKKRLRENVEKFMIFNKPRRWFHSSLVKLPLINMSASWFLVPTYLIWILESRLIRSNNQSSATLGVLDTCLIVGLLPLMIISDHRFIIFSNVQLRLILRRICAFVGTLSTCDKWSTSQCPYNLGLDVCAKSFFFVFCVVGGLVLLECNTSINTSHKTRVSCPSIRSLVSNAMIFDSAELWDTDVCFVHIELMGTNGRLPQRDIKFLPKLTLTPQGPQQNLSLETDPIDNAEPGLPTWQYCRKSLVWWMYEIYVVKRLSHALVNFVSAALVSLFTDHRMSSLPICARCKQFKTICEHTCEKYPIDSWSSTLNWWPSKQGLETVYSFQSCWSTVQSISLNAFLSMSFHVVGPRYSLALDFPILEIFLLLQQKFVIRTFFCTHQ